MISPIYGTTGAALAPTNGRRATKATSPVPKALRCGLYVRVSTDRQAAQEFSSLDAQEMVLRELVASRNAARQSSEPEWTIEQVFRERASAKDTNRPEFQRLMREVEEGRINMIVFIRLDRFSRSLRDFLTLQDFLKEHNCGYVSKYDPMLDTSSPHGEFIVRLLLLLAEYERKLTGARTREKIVAARQCGKWTGGCPPLGYDVIPDKAKLKMNEGEAELVQEIFALYLEKQSLMATVTEMNRRGWSTKSWTSKMGVAHPGTSWSKVTLGRLLTNRVYRGEIPYKGEGFPAEHAPIIDESLFKRVADTLAHGRDHGSAGTRNTFAYLLRGLVFCRACSSAMVPATTRKKKASYRYYRCVSVDKKGTDACPVRYAPAEPLEQFVIDHLRRLGREPELIEETLKETDRQIKDSLAKLGGERKRLEAESRRVEAEARRVMSAPGSMATARLAELEEQQVGIGGRLVEIEGEERKLVEARIDPEQAKVALALLDPVWDVLDVGERERLVRLVIERLEYDGTTGETTMSLHTIGLSELAQPPSASEQLKETTASPPPFHL